jgi:hypothetical protein
MPTVWTGDHEGALEVLNHEDIVSYLTKEVDRNYTAMRTHVRRSVHLSALLIT